MRSGFRLLDTQYVTDHLKTFGATEVPRKRYRTMLDEATARDASVEQLIAGELSGERALEIIASKQK
jgi:leucyl/phenylalanyl-tRNA--protein transferase